MNYTTNGRLFTITSIVAGLCRVVLHTLDPITGNTAYVGKVQLTFPNAAATTHTMRGFKVDDSNTSNIKIFITTTGTVAINGGMFMAYGMQLSDFVPTGFATIPMATGSAQKAVYFLQDPANNGSAQLNIASLGCSIDPVGQIAYVHNGIAATHQYYLYDYSITPNVASLTATITIASPGVVTTSSAHGYNAGDQVQFLTTGTLPTGVVAGTTYFVSATGLTSTQFQFAATTGGASIITTGSQSGTQTSLRAFGIVSSSNFKWKTGNLTPLDVYNYVKDLKN